MKDIPAQYHSFRKTTMGDNILSFRVDQMYSDTIAELVQAQIGTEYVMKLEKVDVNTVLGGSVSSEDPTLERFRRQLYAKCRDYEERAGVTEKEVKSKLLAALSKRNIVVESRKELDIKQLAIAISTVDKWLAE